MRKLKFAKKIDLQNDADRDPYSENHVACEDAPFPHEIDVRDKLHRRRDLEKSHRDFYRVHPSARAWQLRNKLGSECENKERQCKYGREGEHSNEWHSPITLRGRDEDRADKRRRACKRSQRKR